MRPSCKPLVNTRLNRMNGLQRATESFRYGFLSFEHWISPQGIIRNWVKANTRIAVFIAAPTFMAFPVVTLALWELESWTNALTAIAGKLVVPQFLALLAVISISIVLRILRVLSNR